MLNYSKLYLHSYHNCVVFGRYGSLRLCRQSFCLRFGAPRILPSRFSLNVQGHVSFRVFSEVLILYCALRLNEARLTQWETYVW
jgi:hypothetical protein